MARETFADTQAALLDDCEHNKGAMRYIMSTTRGMCPELSDNLLMQLIKDGYTQSEIADRWHKSQSAISRRVARIYAESKVAYEDMVGSDPLLSTLANPDAAADVSKKLWDIKETYEQNYARMIAIYYGAHKMADRVRAAAEIRKHVEGSRKVVDSIYNVDRMRQFVDDVVTVLGEVDPALKGKVLKALHERRGDMAGLANYLDSQVRDEPKAMIRRSWQHG